MIKSILILFTFFFLFSCSRPEELSKVENFPNSKQVEVNNNTKKVDQYYNYNVERNGDEYLPLQTGSSTNEGLNIILVGINTDFKNFERLILSKSGKILSKNERGWYRVKLSEELFEFMEPSCVTDSYERQSDYFTVFGDYSSSYHREVLYPTEPCDTYYKRRNEEKQSGESSGSFQDMSNSEGLEKKTGLPLAVTVKSTENYNGMQVAERQILLIAKDEVSFDDMKRVIEGKGWKLLANNFNMYQVDVSSQGESLDEILKIAETMPEVEVASVNSISSPN